MRTRINIGLSMEVRKPHRRKRIIGKSTHIVTEHDWKAEYNGAIRDEVEAHVQSHHPGWMLAGYCVGGIVEETP